MAEDHRLLQLYSSVAPRYEGLVGEISRVLHQHLIAPRDKHALVHSIKGRVKTYASFRDKALDPTKGKRQVNDALCDKIEDLAGVRVLCLAADGMPAVQDAINKLFRVREAIRYGRELTILAEELTMREEQKVPSNRPPEHKRKASGYRSYHFVVELRDPPTEDLRGLKCEIQVRTLAEEIWGELEHSRYKSHGTGVVNPQLDSLFHIFSELVAVVDAHAQLVAQSAGRDPRLDFRITKSFGLVSGSALHGDLLAEVKAAIAFRNNHEYEKAIVRHQDLIGDLDGKEERQGRWGTALSVEEVERLRSDLRLELALDYMQYAEAIRGGRLSSGDVERTVADLYASAKEIYVEHSQSVPGSLVAQYRMAELHYIEGNYQDAAACAQLSLQALLNDTRFKVYQTDDCVTLSPRLFRKKAAFYSWRLGVTSRERSHVLRAVEIQRQATLECEQAENEAEVRGAQNNLAYYCLELALMSEGSEREEYLADARRICEEICGKDRSFGSNSNFLDTYSWVLFHSGRTAEALIRSLAALQLLSALPQAGGRVRLIREHFDKIADQFWTDEPQGT